MAQHEPTIAAILQELAYQYHTAVAEREILERVLERRPSQAKDPYASIREKLRFGAASVGWVRLDGGELMPLHVALAGLRFRAVPGDDELDQDALLRARLTPFAPIYLRELRLEDAAGQPLPLRETTVAFGEGMFGTISAPAIALGEWFRRSGFRRNDSILVTVTRTEPLTLHLEHEPAAEFRLDDVIQQDRELTNALAAYAVRRHGDPVSAEESVLPVFARAAWRTAYPGRPWRELAAADPRLRLVDGSFIASANRLPDSAFAEQRTAAQDRADDSLLLTIAHLQTELLASRREAADRELWNGLAERASTARVIFDTQAGASTVIRLAPVSALDDYTAQIEERLARGGYDEEGWSEEFADAEDFDPDAALDDLDDEDLDDDLLGVGEIEDMRAFMAQNPHLAEATQKLMAALTPDEIERLQRAGSPEEVQNILATRFHKLLPHEPSLFATLVPYVPDENQSTDEEREPIGLLGEALFGEEEWDELDDWDAADEPSPADTALARSSELMERFYQNLLANGKSEATAASRTGDMWIYADFLASYYNRTLAEGDYATLDECLFFFYPRKVINSSPRAAREMCTSAKQFYAFLRSEGDADDAFAREMWRRRDQAARVVELYEQIDGESPNFARLFARLFAPYTA
jgi:hypothetical protein